MHPFVSPIITECLAYVLRLDTRKSLFRAARARARATGLPLVCVGAPAGGLFSTGGYACVEEDPAHPQAVPRLPCVDLAGCRDCGAVPTDLTMPGAIRAPYGGCVVYSSCVMEYVADIEGAWCEMLRAAGGDFRNVFVVHVEPWSHTSWLYPGAKWRIERAPPEGGLLFRPVYTYPGTPAV